MPLGRVARLVFAALASFAAACGADVDLGGAGDAGHADASCRTCTEPDGGARITCAVPPATPSSCRACSASSATCQPNGCYGGYYCNASTRDCEPPPDCP